ncbi:flagellin [Halocella sp. SP3-1]|nr:flagellin [Halocella sp. SP3-1]
MTINTNVSALNTLNQLNSNSDAVSSSLEKLSSGYAINSAADDAAGLAISEKMETQIRGLDQASTNAEDGISMIQTAEGALDETGEILQRMRELAVQASNDTNTDDDRAEIQKEIDQLIEEIDRIASDTEFNTKKLLNGSMAATAEISSNASGAEGVELKDVDLESGDYTVDIANVATAIDVSSDTTGLSANVAATTGDTASAGSYTIEVAEDNGNYTFTLKNSNGETLDSTTNDYSADFTLGDFTITAGATISEGTLTFDNTVTADVTITDSDGNTVSQETGLEASLTNSVISTEGGIDITVNSDLTDATDTVTVNNKSISFQIGANSGQTTSMAISAMSASDLGVDKIDVSTQEDAADALDAIEEAVTEVSSERAKLGAYQNRLEHTINNLETQSENLTSAQSRIQDADMAAEMTEYSQNNVLTQAATAMLAQANSQNENVLTLLQ